MKVLVTFQVADRHEVEGVRGFVADLLFKVDGHAETYALSGLVAISDEMELAAVTITLNELELSPQIAAHIVEAACRDSWNDLMGHSLAAVGTRWQPAIEWLSTHRMSSNSSTVL